MERVKKQNTNYLQRQRADAEAGRCEWWQGAARALGSVPGSPGHGSGLQAAAAPVVAGAARLGPEAVKTSARNSKSDCAEDENSSVTSSPADASLWSAAARH